MSKNVSTRRRSAALLSVAAMATAGLMTAGPAGAVINGSAGADEQDRPNFFRDDQGVTLVFCDDAVNCEPADTGPDADPLHGGYFGAETVAGPFRIVFGIETASGETEAGEPDTTQAVVSSIARYDGEGLRPGARYVIKHPWGQRTVVADDRGDVNVVDEAGGESAVPISRGTVQTFLRRLNAPAGFLGDLESSGAVTGSPTGFNRIQVTGPGLNLTQRRFTVTGQMRENTPMTSLSRRSLRLGTKTTRRASVGSIAVSSFGTADAAVAARIIGPNRSRFTLFPGTCANVPTGASCTLRVRYAPVKNRISTATLVVRDNNGVVRQVPLKGIGFRTR